MANAQISLRVPYFTRALVVEAVAKTQMGVGEYYTYAANLATEGVLQKNKNLKLVPKWCPIDERERQMVSFIMDANELKDQREAAKRMMIPHSRFVVWATLLVAIADLGRETVEAIAEQVNAELNGSGLK